MAWSVDQANILAVNGGAAGATTVAGNTTAAVASGSWIFGVVSHWTASAITVASVADNGPGLTWEVLGEINNANTRTALVRAYAPSGMSSGTTVTATYSASSTYRGFGLSAFAGGDSASEAENIVTATGSAAGHSVSPTSLTDDALFIEVSQRNNTTAGSVVDANSTEDLDFPNSSSQNDILYHRIGTTAGSYTVGGTWSSGDVWSAVGGAFGLLEPPPYPNIETTAETAVSTAGTSHAITLPSGIATGDLILILLDKGNTAATFNTLTGWTEIVDENAGNGITVWARTADGTEGATVTFTSSASTRSASIAYRISGAEAVGTQAPELSTVATGSSTAPDATTCTPTGGAKDYLWISFFGRGGEEADDDTWVTSAPSNYTGLLQKACGTAGTNLGGMIAAAYRKRNAASEDAGAFTIATGAWRAYTVAVHPAAAGGATVPLQTSAAVSNATLALKAQTTIPLGSSPAQSAATLALKAQTTVPLGTAAAQSNATLALRAPALLTLSSADAQSSATIALTAPGSSTVPLDPAAAISTGTLAFTAQTTIPLGASPAQSAATLALTAQTLVPLQASSAQSSATLALTVPARVSLGSSPAQSAATLALTARTFVPLQSSPAQSAATLALTAPTRVPLGSSPAQSSATLALTAQTYIPLGAATAQSSATLAVITSLSTVPLQTAAATSNATIAVTAKTTVPLQPSPAQSDATLALRAATRIVLAASPAVSNATLAVSAPTVAFVTMGAATGISSAGVLALSTIPPVPLGHIDGGMSTTFGVEGSATSAGVEAVSALAGAID